MTGTRLALLAAGLAAAPAAAAPKLAPDPFEGVVWKAYDKASGPHYQVQTTKTTQAMKVQGLDLKTDSLVTFYLRLTPGDMADGKWVVTRRVLRIKSEVDMGGNKEAYDSADPKAAKGPVSPLYQALLKVDLTFHINPQTFAVIKVEGRDELARQANGANPQLGNLWSDSAVKEMIDPGLAAFPSADRRKGKAWDDGRKWSHDSTVEIGYGASVKAKGTYTWKTDDRVVIESAMEYVPPAAPGGGNVPVTVKSGSLEGKSTGECFAQFDRSRGRFKEVRTGMAVKGTLTIDIGGTETTIDVDQTTQATTTTHDRNPLEGK